MSIKKSMHAKMMPPPLEKGTCRIETIDDEIMLVTPIKDGSMVTSRSHTRVQSTKKWERLPGQNQLLQMLDAEKCSTPTT